MLPNDLEVFGLYIYEEFDTSIDGIDIEVWFVGETVDAWFDADGTIHSEAVYIFEECCGTKRFELAEAALTRVKQFIEVEA